MFFSVGIEATALCANGVFFHSESRFAADVIHDGMSSVQGRVAYSMWHATMPVSDPTSKEAT